MAAESTPFDWDSVPPVCDARTAARALGIGRSTLYHDLENGKFVPGLMPRRGERGRWKFSTKKLRDYVEGGYVKFDRRRR